MLASYFKPPSVFLNTLIGLLGSGWDPVLGGSRVRYFLAPGTGLPPILNAQALDGIPLTIGQSITLQGSSPAIEWQDSIGRVLGRGSQLVYTAEQVKMETLTAQVGESSSRVSFTVSEPGFEVAPHIKAFPDAAKSLKALYCRKLGVPEVCCIDQMLVQEISFKYLRLLGRLILHFQLAYPFL